MSAPEQIMGDEPAFPVSVPGCGDNGWHGMSLRDWFAGNAMAALIIGNAITVAMDEELERSPMDAEARDAYRYADYMLKARQP